ncbi:peptidase M16 [Hahella sp. KA22]|nr:peptidase M16 [Hahella sp. KA22]QAY54493.1 peptidase M16 [Hahella sp. KA22]
MRSRTLSVAAAGTLILVFSFISACSVLNKSPNTMPSVNNNIAKSPNDKRLYRAVTLDNGLQALLISDPETDKAAAAIDVDVGSGADPVGREGLAHFLEHMLFLGTEKYPQPDEYQSFINQHGGSHNAFTAFDHTNYFFDVDADALEPALDRFSQQFVAPLFSEAYVEREKNAVHSEYTSKLREDSRRFFAAVKQAINPDHPMAKFAVGNLETLADRPGEDVRDALLKFYEQHYSADIMKLTVYGKEPLDTMEAWVKEKFSGVKKRDIEHNQKRPPLFKPGAAPTLLSVKPIKEKRSLHLMFEAPPIEPYYHAKPVYYLTNLIGHEGEGSLLSWLKQQNLAEGLSSGLFTSEEDSSVVSVSITLTEKGQKNWIKVVRDVFTYINLIKQQGIEEWRFQEQAKMLDIAYRFQDQAAPIHYVSSLAGRLQDHSPEQVLRAPYAMDDYDAKVLKEFADRLSPENMLAVLSAPEVATDKTERWYETPYSVRAFSTEEDAEIRSPDQQAAIHLPGPNEFIPDDLDLLAGPDMTVPEKIYEHPGYEVWFAKDLSFDSPKSSFYLSIRSPLANKSPRDQALTELFISLARDELSEYSYPAYLAGLDFKLYKHLRGITLRIDGFSDKQPVLLERILTTLKHPELREDRFNQFKKDMLRDLKNAIQDKPFERLASEARTWLLQPYWTEQQQIEALKKITLDDVRAFAPTALKDINLVALAHGNISREQALHAAKVVETQLMAGANIVNVQKSAVVDIQGGDWFKEISTPHQDSAYLYYVQGPGKTYADRAAFGLIAQIISPEYYNDIRTEAQMGYVVFATPYTLLDTPALAFIVQSPSHTPKQIHTATENFIARFAKELRLLPEAEFEKHKAALKARLMEKDQTLEQRSDRFWTEIDVGNEQFDTLNQIASEVDKLSLDQLANYFDRQFVTDKSALLVVTDGDKNGVHWRPGKAEPLKDKESWLNANKLFPLRAKY